jgi:hypothetical protein
MSYGPAAIEGISTSGGRAMAIGGPTTQLFNRPPGGNFGLEQPPYQLQLHPEEEEGGPTSPAFLNALGANMADANSPGGGMQQQMMQLVMLLALLESAMQQQQGGQQPGNGLGPQMGGPGNVPGGPFAPGAVGAGGPGGGQGGNPMQNIGQILQRLLGGGGAPGGFGGGAPGGFGGGAPRGFGGGAPGGFGGGAPGGFGGGAPAGFNGGGGGPVGFNGGGGAPVGFNGGGGAPAGYNGGGGAPAGYNGGAGAPAGYNGGAGAPAGYNGGAGAPAGYNGGAGAPAGYNGGAGAPAGYNGGGPTGPAPGQTGVAAVPQGGPQQGLLAPSNWSQAQQYQYYSNLVTQNGGTMNPNGATVLGIRGQSVDGQVHPDTFSKSYNDSFVVMQPNGTFQVLSGATHPGQAYSSMSPGGNVGELQPGNYRVDPHGPHAGNSSYQVLNQNGTDGLPTARDFNHNGQIDANEANRPAVPLTGVLFHQGNANSPSSIGCQTLSPQNMQKLINAVGGPRAGFNYTLLDANKAQKAAQDTAQNIKNGMTPDQAAAAAQQKNGPNDASVQKATQGTAQRVSQGQDPDQAAQTAATTATGANRGINMAGDTATGTATGDNGTNNGGNTVASNTGTNTGASNTGTGTGAGTGASNNGATQVASNGGTSTGASNGGSSAGASSGGSTQVASNGGSSASASSGDGGGGGGGDTQPC